MKELEVILYGKVQGVGMRAYIDRIAGEMGVLGYVRNTEEGEVEIVAQAEEEVLEKFLKEAKKGPYFARIDAAEVGWHDELQDSLTEFVIEL